MALEIKETLRDSPGTSRILLAYIFPSMGFFTAAGFISDNFVKSWPHCVLAVVLAVVYVAVVIGFFLRRRKEHEIKSVNFEPDGEHFYGYTKQSEEFQQVVEQAIHDKEVNGKLPIISFVGVSGVGKSSFLLHYFRERNDAKTRKLLRIDLRGGLDGIKNDLSEFFYGRQTESILDSESLKEWLSGATDTNKEISRLKDSILIIDQFEQILLNRFNVGYVRALLDSLAEYFCLTIFSSRSDVLGDTIYDARQKDLFSALEIYQKIHLFVFTPIEHPSEDEMEIYKGLFQRIFTTAPEDPELFEKVASASRQSFGDRSTLPIYIKLVMYALEKEDIATVGGLQDFYKGKAVSIDRILTPFFDKMLYATGDQRTSLRILFAMSRGGGIAEGYEAAALGKICGLPQGTDNISHQLLKLEECGTVIKLPGRKFSIVHEHLGEIAARYTERILSLAERDQISQRLTFFKRCVKSTESFYSTNLLDSRSYMRLFSVESYVAMCCVFLACFRLFFWPPYVDSWFHTDSIFLPPALLTCAGVFWSTCLFGNIGKPVRRYQPRTHQALWLVVPVAPVVALGLLFLWPDKWLFIATGTTLAISANQLLTGHWAITERSKDVAHLFTRYGYTGLGLSVALALGQVLLDRVGQSDPESVSALAFFVSILISCGVLRFAITWWNGRNQRNILAQIDSGIVVKRALDKVKLTEDQK